MNNTGNNRLSGNPWLNGLLTPFDIITICYILLTFLFIIIGVNKVQEPWFHLGIRAGILLLITCIIILHNRRPNKLTAFIRNFYPLALLAFWYSETYVFHSMFFPYIDPYLEHLEYILFGLQPSLEFSKVIHHLWVSELLFFGYFAFYAIIVFVCLIVYISRRDKFTEVMYSLLFSFYFFYLFFAIVPSMGPYFWFHLHPDDIPQGYLFANGVKLAQEIGEKPTGAFPSSHVGISVALLCLSFMHIRKWFWVFLPVVLLLCAATVYIKVHYLMDVIGGLICVPLLLWLSRYTFSRFPVKEVRPAYHYEKGDTD